MKSVSVIVPCYNEQATIHLLLESLYQQTFPLNALEVVIADGMSTDGTRQVIDRFLQEYPGLAVRVIENKNRTIPSGLNLAIKHSKGDYIIRLDAHSIPCADYLARCVADLELGLGDNVGGVWEIKPGDKSWFARSIAWAAANPLGVGDARYRFTSQAGIVDTVPFGSFHRSLVDKIGYYDENLLTNEDYEFNARIRQAGGKIWLDPEIRSIYFARASITALSRQYWRYGYWKARMLRHYPRTIRWRQVLPPIFVISICLFGLGSLFLPAVRWIFWLELGIYILALMIVGLYIALKNRDVMAIFGIPLAIATMHISWGSAFLWSVIHRQ